MSGPSPTTLILASMTTALTLVSASAAVSSAQAAPGAAAAASAITRTTTLPTGQRVALVREGGRVATAVLPSTGARNGVDPSGGAVSVRRVDGHVYVMPAVADHYAGVLDPSLFDVTALTEQATAGRIPVSLSLTSRDGVVPGVTITSRNATQASGYLTASTAAQFGRALVSQWRAEAGSGRPSSSPLGVRHMALQSAAASLPKPTFAQVTLTLEVVGPDGEPVDAFVVLANVDNGLKYRNIVPVIDGLARVSVPVGHYSAVADYTRYTDDTATVFRAVVAGEPVTTNGQTLTLDERTATTRPSVRTPRPTAQSTYTSDVALLDSENQGAVDDVIAFPGSTLRISPTPAPKVGRLYYKSDWQLSATADGPTPYTYDLAFLDNGIPADLRKNVVASQLAVVRSRYFSDSPRVGGFGRGIGFPYEDGPSEWIPDFDTPAERTEYVNMPADGVWGAVLFADSENFAGFTDDQDRVYTPGRAYQADWLRGPIGPDTLESSGVGPFSCPVCRRSNRMSVDLSTITDTTAGHSGFLTFDNDPLQSHLTVTEDGTQIFDRAGTTYADLPVPVGAHTYRVVATSRRGLAGYRASTAATTDLTFVSSAGDSGALPAGWDCAVTGSGRCGIPAAMTARVLLPTSLSDTMPVGATDVDFSVGHIQGARTIAVRSASLSISLDGKTFTAQPVTDLGGGRYRARLTTPDVPAGTGVTVRVSGTDAAGGSIIKTVTDAYVVAGS